MARALTLHRLEYFATVAEELHFGRSAERLHMAQPALSRQIRQLEQDLGLELFTRTTRRVALTAAGEEFLGHARHLLAAADSVEAVAAEIRTGGRGRLRLGFVDSSAYELVPRFLHRFRGDHPETQVELHTMSSDEQGEALARGVIDLGVARTSPARFGVASTVVGHEPLVVASPDDHEVADRSWIRLRTLRDATFVGFDRGHSPTLHAELVGLLGRHGVVYAPAVEATEYTTILGLVAAGEGLALVPAGVRSIRLPGLRFVTVRDRDATVGQVVLTREGEHRAVVDRARAGLAQTAEAIRNGQFGDERRGGRDDLHRREGGDLPRAHTPDGIR